MNIRRLGQAVSVEIGSRGDARDGSPGRLILERENDRSHPILDETNLAIYFC
jgi:hypothetical protein